MSLLFDQKPSAARAMLYDADWQHSNHIRLESAIVDRLAALFRLHGAIDHEPPLFLPATQTQQEDPATALFLDRQGEIVALPRNSLLPFARLAAATKLKRIKRFHIGNVYQYR